MQTSCQNCNSTITFEADAPPKFCSECGTPLTDSGIDTSEDPTLAHSYLPLKSLGTRVGETLTRQPSDGNVGLTDDDRPQDLAQQTVGPYRLIRKLGQGGMGSVYEAIHEQTEQSVALKLLMPSLRTTDESVQRFQRESQIAASINHPRSTFVYEAGQHNEQFYITMELMDGGTLKDIVNEHGPLEVGQAVDYMLDIIDGLTVAHEAGIVHRDLKPSNCFIDQEGRVKIGDFGLAKSFLGDSQLTLTGQFMGTPQYAAPEQLRASNVDEKADIYAIGATLFFLLAGRPPFSGNPAQVIASIASETPPRINKFTDGIPKDLVRLIAQTLEKDPNRRPQRLEVLRDSLRPYSTRGASLADIGRRMAAFFIDYIMAGLLSGILTQLLTSVTMMGSSYLGYNPEFKELQVWSITFQVTLVIAYFAICEHRWGHGLGKWLLGMRVIGSQSESPGILAATIRAAIVPGITSLSSTIPVAILLSEPPNDVREAIGLITQVNVAGLFSWIPTLLCMSTARQTNGYRGLHGLLSGTRVVRLSGDLETRRLDSVPVTAPVQLDSSPQFGPYSAIAQFDKQLVPAAYLANDPTLDRSVWIFDDVPLSEIDEERRRLTRPNRLRLIYDGSRDGSNWFAAESIKGVPLIELLGLPEVSWNSIRPLFRELAVELNFSAQHQMLPRSMNVDHVWVDTMSRIKLLDYPVVRSRFGSSLQRANSPIKAAPVQGNGSDSRPGLKIENHVFLQLLNQYIEHHVVPVHVIELRNEFARRRDSDDSLEWAAKQLADFADRPSGWNWDDRLGVLAISAGFEYGLLTTVVFLTGLLCIAMNLGGTTLNVATFGIGSAVMLLLGYLFHGGVAFRLSDVAVLRQKDFLTASRWRCAIRNWVAWSPLITVNGLFFYLLFYSMELGTPNVQITRDGINATEPMMIVFLLALGPLILIVLAGVLTALVSPARGIPDFIVGSRLARK